MFGLDSEQMGFVLYAVALAFIGIIGGSKGKEFIKGSPAASQKDNVVEVAGAIVSDKKVNELIDAVNVLVGAVRDHGAKLASNTAACDGMGRRIDIAADAMHELSKELEIEARSRAR